MTLLTLDDLGHAYGDFDVFTALNAQIGYDEKIGLVGPNGIGKTTLLQIIAGLQESSEGDVKLSDDILQIGYLPQEAAAAFAQKTNTLHREMRSVFDHVREMAHKMREIEARMTAGSATDDEYTEYGDLQEAFEHAEGYDYERRIERTLDGLGFTLADRDTPLQYLSGGQKTRALLAKLLLTNPDLLILDEPTNHLDAAAVNWLEGTLKTWNGALLIVSHDRYFLDKVVTRIWEMTRTHIEIYKGNYSSYVNQRQMRQQRTLREWQSVMDRFWNEFKFIEKHIAQSDNARGRMKKLAREVDAVQRYGLEAVHVIQKKGWAQFTNEYESKRPPATVSELRQALNSLESPIQRQRNMRIKLRSEERSADLVMRTHNLQVGHDGQTLFTVDNIELQRREVAALIGPNGAGKSTFLRTMMGEVKPIHGRLRFGVNVQLGYFAQAHEDLQADNTLVDELLRHAPDEMAIGAARSYLARYLFQGDDVFKRVERLSGGERARLALAILALQGANFLLLDEPTNHLDIPAQEVLQNVLEGFDGTILLVSHDRYLVDRLATQIWELRGGHLRIYESSYANYLQTLAAENAAGTTDDQPEPTPEPAQPTADMQRLEAQIQTLEGSLKEMGILLQHANAANSNAADQLNAEYVNQQARLKQLQAERDAMRQAVN